MTSAASALVLQRMRNGIISYLEAVSSYEGIASLGAFEAINEWEDWVPRDGRAWQFSAPVFADDEREAIAAFTRQWNLTADSTEDDLFDARVLRRRPEWRAFVDAAGAALRVFERRGRFLQDVDVL